MFDTPADEGASGGSFLQQLPAILWQRRWFVVLPAVVGIVVAIGAAILIPPSYRSNAIMLVESPQLPKEVIGLDAGNMIDRRIAAIRQQITARPDLIQLIERHGLYASQRKSTPLSEILDEMRSAITLTPAETSPGGGSENRTIAFELAFEYSQPEQTQAVAQDLMDRVLQLDARGNAEQAANTVQFLTDQSAGLEAQISSLQSQIADITARNGNVLAGGGMIVGGSGGSYDVQIAALQRDNQLLIQQRNLAQTSDQRDPIVSGAEQRLAAARAVYAETHPDVILAKQALAEAKRLAKDTSEKLPIQTLDEQIAFNNSQIAALRGAKANETAQLSSRLAAQAKAPLVQQQLGELQQRLAAVNTQYEQVQNQLMGARAGVRAEDEQMSERLSVVEPPVIPDQPSWPNRLLIGAIGVFGGLGAGIVLALAIELFLRPIRDPAALNALLGAPPLGIIPVIEVKNIRRDRWRRFLPSRSQR
ncbi:MAG: lipopolysaccharide biosynthesis protein [Sphingopyxis sp.]|uniref:GumC family protein n=1 Tax=Sphingopyxis sp. TaxID=1908224 RepID=UPI001A22818B|nr:Wzz/FepE/Etk N-terminal domain-containing protein [Sphingopyxis sp.]MBJ7499697.1 lipopolysaccharide biosynthesis protein [Sphingopyxis sp.]